MKEKYTIDCKELNCDKCPASDEDCTFYGTKAQVKAFIKRHFKQPKIKKVVGE